jgi:hypothetical protein
VWAKLPGLLTSDSKAGVGVRRGSLKHVAGSVSGAGVAPPPAGGRLGDWETSQGPKGEILAHFQEIIMCARPVCVCVRWHVTFKQHFRSNFSRRQVGGPAQPLRAGVGERKWVSGGMVSDSRSLLSAGECLVVSTVALCGAKLNSLTPLGSVAPGV